MMIYIAALVLIYLAGFGLGRRTAPECQRIHWSPPPPPALYDQDAE